MRSSMHGLLSVLSALALAGGAVAQSGQAIYDLTFATTWSAQTHPNQFPAGPHFSPLIGGTHDASVSFWQIGGLATPGIEQMAELGAAATLAGEVTAAINAGNADQVLWFSGLPTSPASNTIRFTVDAAHSRLTLVSMLAPSPDWFVGTSGLELLQNGRWVDDLLVPLHVYDAGTDSGTTYTSPDQNTVPQQPIGPVTTTSGPFQGLPGPVGSYTLRRIASTLVYGCGTNPTGSMAVSGRARLGDRVTLRIDDVNGTLTGTGQTVFAFAAAPDAAFPCGSPLPGLGLAAPGTAGELLVAPPVVALAGGAWSGTPVTFALDVPVSAALIDARACVQGAIGTSAGAGVTDAVELVIGPAGA